MKRYWVLVFMGFFITAVNAVTMSWTSSGNVDGTNTIQSGSFSVVAVITTSAFDYSSVSVNVLTTEQSSWMGNGESSVTMTNEGVLKFANNSNSASTTLTKNTSYVLAAVFNATKSTLTWSLNGEVVFTVDNLFGFAESTSINSYAGSEDFYTLNEITGYEGVLTSEELDLLVKNKTSQIPTVPEPTIFALLAMGVAGLVLKRRI